MKPGFRKLGRGVGLTIALAAAIAVLASPAEDGICEHVLELAAAAGEDAAGAGIDHEACATVMASRRDRMNLVRRSYYGWCVRVADSLDDVGRC